MTRCILLTPCLEYDDWLREIARGVADAGLELIVVHSEVSPQMIDAVYLSTNPVYLRPTQDAETTVIVSHVESAVRQTETLTGATKLDAVVDASRLLAEAFDFTAQRRFDDIGLADKIEIELFQSITARVPGKKAFELSPIEVAAKEALLELSPDTATANWSPILFDFDRRRPVRAEAGVHVIDLTGPPRAFQHGPYLTLPAGTWEICVSFSVDADAMRYRFCLRWGTLDKHIAYPISFPRPGLYEATLTYVWEKSAKAELRMEVLEGCMDGQVFFYGCKVRKIS